MEIEDQSQTEREEVPVVGVYEELKKPLNVEEGRNVEMEIPTDSNLMRKPLLKTFSIGPEPSVDTSAASLTTESEDSEVSQGARDDNVAEIKKTQENPISDASIEMEDSPRNQEAKRSPSSRSSSPLLEAEEMEAAEPAKKMSKLSTSVNTASEVDYHIAAEKQDKNTLLARMAEIWCASAVKEVELELKAAFENEGVQKYTEDPEAFMQELFKQALHRTLPAPEPMV